jgi:hypothetical protein
VVVYKSSPDGKTTLNSPGYRFSADHHSKGMLHRPSVEEIREYILKKAMNPVPDNVARRGDEL